MNKEESTHLLSCRHCVGTNQCREYQMYCILLGETKNRKAKILVIGERDWKLSKNNQVSIRYVEADRLTEIIK